MSWVLSCRMLSMWSSHTGTVCESCKNDNQSQLEKPKFDPPPPINPLTDGHQNLLMWLRDYIVDIYHPAKFHLDQMRGFVSAHAQFRASYYLLGCLFVFWGVFKSSTAKTPHGFRRKIRQKTRFHARMCLFGSQNQKLSFTPLFAPKTAILGPVFDGTLKFSHEDAFNIGHALGPI